MGRAIQWQGLKSEEWAVVSHSDRAEVARLCRKHGEIGRPLALDYVRELGRRSRPQPAIERLRVLSQELELGKTGLTATVHDAELKKWCERHAEEIAGSCDQWTKTVGVVEAWEYANARLAECGMPCPPIPKNPTKRDFASAFARIFDAKWWRLQVRKIQARKIEAVAREIQLVHKDAGIYASNATVGRRKLQKLRNKQSLTNMEAVNDAGDVVSLLDCVKSSVANPVNRRAELMVRIKGFEQCAETAGHVGVFVTLTAPSKYHRMTRLSYHQWSRTVPNKKYKGFSPRDAQDYFCHIWSQMRAQMWREEIRPYGFRVAEPHHDGTPHWHFLLFIEPDQAARMSEIMTDYGLREDGQEWGAQNRRVTVVNIDPEKGSAAGYIAKYISKNIDGHGIEEDLYGKDAKDSSERIDAWAAAWGIRQFQQIGGASVTVWRELRRLKIEDMTGRFDYSQAEVEQLLDTWTAADSSDWAAYTMLQGGMSVRRDEQFIRSQYQADGFGKYYQPVERLIGVAVRSVGEIVTRLTRWTLQRTGTAKKQAERQQRAGGWRAEARADDVDEWADIFGPWTSVYYGTDGDGNHDPRPRPFSDVAGYRRFQAAPAATWTRDNNCTPVQLLSEPSPPGGGALGVMQ